MGFARVFSAQNKGLSAEIISVEVDVSGNSFSYSLVGLPDKSVDEAKERISTALKNTGFPSPKNINQATTISLLPPSVRKRGSFDVPIAVSFLKAKGELDFKEDEKIFVGELSLSGEIMPAKGALPIASFAKQNGFKELFVPAKNAKEAALIEGIKVYPVSSLKELAQHLKRERSILPIRSKLKKADAAYEYVLDEIVGQEFAKRAITIAAAGGHNIALYGQPGVGKSMLAKTLSELLPELTMEEIIQVSSIYSVAGIANSIVTKPPFRDPHHSSSFVSIIGGGAEIKPGEVSLAHKGVLFFDELPEYESRTVNALRQPLEQKKVTISRAKETVTYPADFLFVAALNPCPCGYYGTDKCVCMPHQIKRYQNKISGPIVDRIDIWTEVEKVPYEELLNKKPITQPKQHEQARQKIKQARSIQYKRQGKLNTNLSAKEVYSIKLSDNQKQILQQAAENLNLSMRVVHKLIKLARTIADLEASPDIKDEHILEALSFRKPISYSE